MKKMKRFIVIMVMMALIFSINVFAAEDSMQIYNESRSYSPDYKEGDKTSYRCPNSNCRAYLIYKYKVGNCEYGDGQTHAYKCSHCTGWYCICESGHFNHVYGR